MIFKPREPAVDETQQTSDDAKVAAEEPSNEQSSTEPGARTEDAPDGDALAGAFEALGQVMAREMATMKRMIADLEARLARRIESEKAATTSTIGELRQDVIARVEALRQSQQKALSELSEQSKASIAGLRGRLEPAVDKANQHTDEVRAGLERILAGSEKKLQQELQALTHALSLVRADLDRQVDTSGRVSDLLNNMADLFSEPGSLPEQPPVRASGEPGSSRSDP
jgi:hypothetical protein